MELEALMPAAGEGRGAAFGILVSFVLHPVALIVAAVAGAKGVVIDGAFVTLASTLCYGLMSA